MTTTEAVYQDMVDLLRALRDALDADVRRGAIQSAISAVLIDEATPAEAASILRRLATSKSRRRTA